MMEEEDSDGINFIKENVLKQQPSNEKITIKKLS